MRIGWLFNRFVDPEHRLTPEQEKVVWRRANDVYMPRGKLVLWTIVGLVLPAMLIMGKLVPWILDEFGLGSDTLAHAIAWGVFLILFWPASAIFYALFYRPAIRAAMADVGREVCVGCGYQLAEAGPAIDRCPECGRERVKDAGGSPDGDT